MKKIFSTLFTCLFMSAAYAGNPDSSTLVVCYPGGAVSPKDANPALDSMLRVVERIGQWQPNSLTSVFTAKADECKALMDEKNPKFAITSLGLYLQLKDQHNLIPLAQPIIKGSATERYRVVVKKRPIQQPG